jgi:hypothetical protein
MSDEGGLRNISETAERQGEDRDSRVRGPIVYLASGTASTLRYRYDVRARRAAMI